VERCQAATLAATRSLTSLSMRLRPDAYGGGEGVVAATPRVPAGSHTVSVIQPRDPACFCRKIQCVIGAEVYWKSTGGSALGKSAAKHDSCSDCTGCGRPSANLHDCDKKPGWNRSYERVILVPRLAGGTLVHDSILAQIAELTADASPHARYRRRRRNRAIHSGDPEPAGSDR